MQTPVGRRRIEASRGSGKAELDWTGRVWIRVHIEGYIWKEKTGCWWIALAAPEFLSVLVWGVVWAV
jgi:hypothetical protein